MRPGRMNEVGIGVVVDGGEGDQMLGMRERTSDEIGRESSALDLLHHEFAAPAEDQLAYLRDIDFGHPTLPPLSPVVSAP